MSSTKHDILVSVTQTGITQVDNAMRQFSNTSGLATKSQDALGGSLGKTQGAAVKLRSDVDKGERSTAKANTTTGKFAQSQDKAAGSTKSFAEKFQGNRGLIFSVTGIITAGVEAIGMFQNFQNALAKQADAQARLTELEQQGITTGREYTQAQKDLDDAGRSVTFALRIMALSMGDLIPFSLLLVNQFVNMRAAAQQAAAAKQTLTATTQALGAASQQAAAGGLAQMFTSTGQVANGVNALTPAVRNTTVATNELFTSSGRLVTGFTPMGRAITDNTNFIGTRNSGLVGGMNALNTGMITTERQGGRFTNMFGRIGTGITGLTTRFTTAGTSLKTFFVSAAASIGGFFTSISTNIKGTDGILNKFKSGFAGLAGGVMTGSKGISGALTALGAAVAGFGKALIGAFLTNPITGAILAIGVAVAALIFDFGGFRTAINQVGVAIGNAIPFLKGALTWIGEVGNAALDSVAGFLGFETSAQKAAKAAEALRTVGLDPLIISLEKYLDLGDQFQNLNQIIEHTSELKEAILGLTQSTNAWEDQSVRGYNQVYAAAETYFSQFTNLSANAEAQKYALLKAINLLETGNYDLKDAVNILMTAYNAFDQAQGEEVKTTAEATAAKQELEKQIQLNIKSTGGNAEAIRQLIASQREQEKAGKSSGAVMADGTKIVQDFTNAIGLNVEENQKLADNLLNNAEIIALVGNKNVILKDGIIDVAASIDTWRISNRTLEIQTQQTYDTIISLLEEGKISMKEAIAIVEAAKKVDKEHGALLDEKFKNYQSHIEKTQEDLSDLIDAAVLEKDTTVKANNDVIESEAKRRQSLIDLVKQMGLNIDTQELSTDTLQVATDTESEAQKQHNATIATLQKLALQRGLEADLLEQGTEEHLKYIKTHDIAAPTIDEVRARTAQLIAARQEDQKATQLEQATTEDYVKSLGFHIDATGLSAKGLLAVVDAYDETTNASQIATDDVATWAAQLTRNQAVEEETIKQLLEYARVHGITIPDEVERSSSAIKDFIENGLEEIGPAAEEAAKEAKAAFDEIAGKAHSVLEGIISDKLGEDGDEIKKAIKGIRKVGVELDSVTAAKHIIQVFLDDENFENDLQSLGETMLAEFGRLEGFSREEGIIIGDNFVTNLADSIDGKMPEAANAILKLWNDVKSNPLPGETGDEMLGRFLEMVQNDQALSDAGLGMSSSIAGGIAKGETFVYDEAGNLVKQVGEGAVDGSGRHLPPASNKMLDQLMVGFNQNPLPKEKGEEVAEDIGDGAADGSGRILPPASNKMLEQLMSGFNASPLPKQTGEKVGSDTATGVETGVEPIPGIFNQAFVDASTLSGATLIIILQAVQQTMSNMSTSVATYSNSMKVNFTTAIQEMTLALPPLNEAVVLAQQTMSTLSTSVSTYANSMMTRITTFVNQAVQDIGTWDIAMINVKQTASDLSTSVATYSNSMKTNISSFRTSAESDLGLVEEASVDLREESSSTSSTIASHMSSMTSRVSSFASSAAKNFSNVGSAARSAASDVNKLKSAIDSLKDKTVTITVRYRTVGSPGGAQHGGSFIIDKPDRVAGVRVAETFPELATITPLDPKEPNSPFHNVDADLNIPNIKPQMPSLDGISTTGGGAGGSGSNVTVQGNLYATIQLPSGETLAKTVKPFMLKGYSGIVS